MVQHYIAIHKDIYSLHFQFQFNLTLNDIKVENMSKVTACKKIIPRTKCMIFTDSSSSSSFENTNLTNHSSNVLEILHVSRFPSDLVHRHVMLTFYFLLIICPDNTL